MYEKIFFVCGILCLLGLLVIMFFAWAMAAITAASDKAAKEALEKEVAKWQEKR